MLDRQYDAPQWRMIPHIGNSVKNQGVEAIISALEDRYKQADMNSNRENKMKYSGSMRIVQIIFWITSGVVIIGGAFLMLPDLIFPFFALISPKTPEPEVTYGEFPLGVEYELDGQINITEDTVIAEFNECELSAGSMKKERRWRNRLASSREDLPFGDDLGIYFNRGSA